MFRAFVILGIAVLGMSWVLADPDPDEPYWQLVGWLLVVWALFNVRDFVIGSRAFAKLILALLLAALGLAFVNGDTSFLEALF